MDDVDSFVDKVDASVEVFDACADNVNVIEDLVETIVYDVHDTLGDFDNRDYANDHEKMLSRSCFAKDQTTK